MDLEDSCLQKDSWPKLFGLV